MFATPQARGDRLRMRHWFYFYVACLAGVCLVCLKAVGIYTLTGNTTAWAIWLLGLYFFYLSLACTFVPLPTSWFVLLLASPAGGLGIDWPYRVLLVGGVGAAATALSHVNEYHLINYMLRLGSASVIRQSRAYKWAEGLFLYSPFLLQVAFNVLPIPADPGRWLATLHRYPLPKFIAAQWLGRFIRYTVMGIVAETFALTVWQIAAIQAALLVAAAVKIAWNVRRRHCKISETTTVVEGV